MLVVPGMKILGIIHKLTGTVIINMSVHFCASEFSRPCDSVRIPPKSCAYIE